MTKPTIPARIGNDVYIRDNEDRTVQFRARVYDIDFTAQEAQVGFYPERGREFSQIHLPDIYRAQLPLSELSLEPHSGAVQKGYAEALIASGVQPTALAYMDTVGKVWVPGDPQISESEIPQPDFSDVSNYVDVKATTEKVLTMQADASGVLVKAVKAAVKPTVITTQQVLAAAQTLVRDMGKPPPLFTKEDVVAKCKQLRDEMDKLLAIAEGL